MVDKSVGSLTPPEAFFAYTARALCTEHTNNQSFAVFGRSDRHGCLQWHTGEAGRGRVGCLRAGGFYLLDSFRALQRAFRVLAAPVSALLILKARRQYSEDYANRRK